MKRGEVYWADLVLRSGSEQTGRRPVVVVSHNGFNEVPTWRSIIIVPISTSTSQTKRGPTIVELGAESAGLSRRSFAICHQVTTLDRAKLLRRIGTVAPHVLDEIQDGLKAAMDLD